MGCSCTKLFKKRRLPRRRSSFKIRSLRFYYTDIVELDTYFSKIKKRASEITSRLQALQYSKSHFYHKLALPKLFTSPNSTIASTSLVLYLVASGNKIEFIDSCPYLQVYAESDLFFLYTKYVEMLHESIVALTELKPELQENIAKAKDYMTKISSIADREGLDLCQKLNLIAIVVNNCQVLWGLPEIVESRLLSVKKDLMDLKIGIKDAVSISAKFSLMHGCCEGLLPEDAIRQVWHDPEQLK